MTEVAEQRAKANAWTHDSKQNQTVDWWTPRHIFDLLGLEFDLDPCSPKGGVPWIPAKHHFSIEDDGLHQPWEGRVWLNPPYGEHTPDWLARMDAHRNGVALVFARTDPAWFHDYVTKADAILFLLGRIPFVDGLQKTQGGGAGSGSMLIAWGLENVAALERFDAEELTRRFWRDRGGKGRKPITRPGFLVPLHQFRNEEKAECRSLPLFA